MPTCWWSLNLVWIWLLQSQMNLVPSDFKIEVIPSRRLWQSLSFACTNSHWPSTTTIVQEGLCSLLRVRLSVFELFSNSAWLVCGYTTWKPLAEGTMPQRCSNIRRILLANTFEGCDKKPVCFGTTQDFLPFDGGQVCPEGHAYCW